jgi:hypothetical protein
MSAYINAGVIKDTVCVNAVVVESIELAADLFARGGFGDADTIAAIPEGFGIGDLYTGAGWEKRPSGDDDDEY